jgi:hypothetical protein
MMPSWIPKWKKGKPSLYWVRSARVHSHARIVEQLSLGPKERVMDPLRTQVASVPQTAALPALQTVPLREFGASAGFYALAQELGLLELINAHVPPAPPRRRTSRAVGHSLVLAAINRAAWPKSKRAVGAWYQDTGLARLMPASRDELSSPRLGDPMALCEPEHCAPLQRELVHRMHARFPLGEQCLVYATTHSYPFLHTFHRRPSLPQRGRNNQRRDDLRQSALALVGDEERGLPLYYRGYEGTGTDVVALGTSLHAMAGHCLPPTVSPRLPVVLDKGTVSRDNFKALPQAHIAFLAALPAGWGRRLSQVSLQAYQPLALPDGRRLKGYGPPHQKLAGIQGQLLGRCSPSFYRKQVRTLDRLQRQAAQPRLTLQAALQQAVARHRPRTEQAVKGEIAPLVRHDRLQECFACTRRLDQQKVQEVRWQWDQRKKRALKPHDFGKTVLLTDRRELAPQRRVMASRRQAPVASRCRISTSRRPGVGWPA